MIEMMQDNFLADITPHILALKAFQESGDFFKIVRHIRRESS